MASCKTCRYMRGPYEVPANPQISVSEGYRAGWCHRTVPELSPDLKTSSHRTVRLTGWCGEYRWRSPWWFWPLVALVAVGVLSVLSVR